MSQKEYEGNKPGGEESGEFEKEHEKKAWQEAEARRLESRKVERDRSEDEIPR